MANPNRDDVAKELAIEQASIAAFHHPADAIDERVQQELVTQLADALSPVMQFIARGRLGGTMALRSWIFLHETRLDMVAGESIESCAKREGVSVSRVYELIKEFRACVPGYRPPNTKSAATRARMSAAARRGRPGQPPPGKESLSPGGSLAGSVIPPNSTTGE